MIKVDACCLRQLSFHTWVSHHTKAFKMLNEFSALQKNAAVLSGDLKVHKIENFFGSDFEFCVISLLVMLNRLQ